METGVGTVTGVDTGEARTGVGVEAGVGVATGDRAAVVVCEVLPVELVDFGACELVLVTGAVEARPWPWPWP